MWEYDPNLSHIYNMHDLHFHQHTSVSNMIYNLYVGGEKMKNIRMETVVLLSICGFPLEHPIQRKGRRTAPRNIVASERLGSVHAY